MGLKITTHANTYLSDISGFEDVVSLWCGRFFDQVKVHDNTSSNRSSWETHVVSVLVGPDRGSFKVYEHFVCSKSKVFEAACRKE
jgi:hypothetical protein